MDMPMKRKNSVQIDPELCRACPRCQASKVCRMKVIVQLDPGEQPYFEGERCRDCQTCIPACPYGAVRKTRN
jgi:MinD superfamily P-loop ATPase